MLSTKQIAWFDIHPVCNWLKVYLVWLMLLILLVGGERRKVSTKLECRLSRFPLQRMSILYARNLFRLILILVLQLYLAAAIIVVVCVVCVSDLHSKRHYTNNVVELFQKLMLLPIYNNNYNTKMYAWPMESIEWAAVFFVWEQHHISLCCSSSVACQLWKFLYTEINTIIHSHSFPMLCWSWSYWQIFFFHPLSTQCIYEMYPKMYWMNSFPMSILVEWIEDFIVKRKKRSATVECIKCVEFTLASKPVVGPGILSVNDFRFPFFLNTWAFGYGMVIKLQIFFLPNYIKTYDRFHTFVSLNPCCHIVFVVCLAILCCCVNKVCFERSLISRRYR